MSEDDLEGEVYEMVCENPGITRDDIVKKINCSAKKLESAIVSLLKQNLIQRESPNLHAVSFVDLIPKKLISRLK